MNEQLLLQITRGVRAERPSEAVISADSDAVTNSILKIVDGAPVVDDAGFLVLDTVQDASTDNFFTLDKNLDLQQNVDKLLSTMANSSLRLQGGDGWRIVAYAKSKQWTQDYTHKSYVVPESEDMEGNVVPEYTVYPEIQVQYTQEESSGSNKYNGVAALTDATDFIATLGDSDGWMLIQELKISEVIDSRPSLWIDGEFGVYIPIRGAKASRLLGRTENDRY
tara:strand:+ start:198 stop:866 length:669 start_codon:yes stop_codon:yes gene_type:complete